MVPHKFAILQVLTERMQIDASEPELMPRRRTFDELTSDMLMKQLAICMPMKDYEKAYNYQSEQKTFSEWQDAVAKSPFLKKLYETDMLKTAMPPPHGALPRGADALRAGQLLVRVRNRLL